MCCSSQPSNPFFKLEAGAPTYSAVKGISLLKQMHCLIILVLALSDGLPARFRVLKCVPRRFHPGSNRGYEEDGYNEASARK